MTRTCSNVKNAKTSRPRVVFSTTLISEQKPWWRCLGIALIKLRGVGRSLVDQFRLDPIIDFRRCDGWIVTMERKKTCATIRFQQTEGVLPKTVVLNLFYISYLFITQVYQIYPQYTQWCSFIENTKLTNSYSLEWFIKVNIACNLWFRKFTPLADDTYPRLRIIGLRQRVSWKFSKRFLYERLRYCQHCANGNARKRKESDYEESSTDC